MFYPHPFGYPIQFPFPPYSSTGHLLMPIYQEINKDIKQSEDAKDGNGLYRNCLVCGDKNYKCGWSLVYNSKNKIKFICFSD
jgi:hypothetical protein